MKVTIIRDEYIPSGFKCTGCRRLMEDPAAGRYYCELFLPYLEQDSKGTCYKTDECLLAVKKELLKR